MGYVYCAFLFAYMLWLGAVLWCWITAAASSNDQPASVGH
jgi:hypothetical protein